MLSGEGLELWRGTPFLGLRCRSDAVLLSSPFPVLLLRAMRFGPSGWTDLGAPTFEVGLTIVLAGPRATRRVPLRPGAPRLRCSPQGFAFVGKRGLEGSPAADLRPGRGLFRVDGPPAGLSPAGLVERILLVLGLS